MWGSLRFGNLQLSTIGLPDYRDHMKTNANLITNPKLRVVMVCARSGCTPISFFLSNQLVLSDGYFLMTH